jgi:hypothetical protein
MSTNTIHNTACTCIREILAYYRLRNEICMETDMDIFEQCDELVNNCDKILKYVKILRRLEEI